MDLIKTHQETVRERMGHAAQMAAAQFIKFIKPIYGTVDGKIPIHIGSCIFLEWKSKKYVLTAAHIIDERPHAHLYTEAAGKLFPLEADFHCTNKPSDDRKKDHFDFAWCSADEFHHGVDFVQEESILTPHEYDTSNFHVALGYPNSRNKKVDNVKKSIKPQYLNYSSPRKEMPELSKKMGVSGKQHLFLPYDRSSRDPDGGITNSLSPKGCSGGALIDMGNIVAFSTFRPDCECKGRLAGMLIEHPKIEKAIVAVKIDFILKHLN